MLNVKKPEQTDHLARLLTIMAQLRAPESGCPWDRAQSMQSLTRYTIEEAYEVVNAVETEDDQAIKDELGDLLFQVVFYAQIAAEQGQFTFNDVAAAISDKMVRRHPHVFADVEIDDDQLAKQWDAIKAEEKAARKEAGGAGILADVPAGLPALMYAQKLQKRCAQVGFDWDNRASVFDKVKEEIEEIQQEIDVDGPNTAQLEDEIGDALFALVNLARHCDVDADTALRKASQKFSSRFTIVEALAKPDGGLEAMSLAQMEQLWQQAKKHHR